MTAISTAIIARDAERTLAGCLASVAWADDVVVILDPRSADRSDEIARAAGARLVPHAFEGHVAQKNFALGAARHDWVLALDADEEVCPGLGEEIRGLRPRGLDGAVAGYALERRSFYLGRPIRRAWGGDVKLRLVDRRRARWTGLDPHDRLVADGRTERLAEPLLHYPYASVADHLARAERYSSIAAASLHAAGRRARWWDVAVRPPFHFVKSYLARGGVLDGYPGFVIAAVGASGVLMKYLKLRELDAAARDPREQPRTPPG